MKISSVAFLLLSCVFFCGCSTTITPKMLVGNYAYQLKSEADTIEILANNTYIHHTYINCVKRTDIGKWTFNVSELKFYDFCGFNSEGCTGKGLWI